MLAPFTARMRFTWEGKYGPGWEEPWRRLYDTLLVITSGGPYTLQFEHQTYTMVPGSVVLIPPATRHRSFVDAGPGSGLGAFRHCVHFTFSAEGYPEPPPLMCMEWETFNPRLVQKIAPEILRQLPLVRMPEEVQSLLPVTDLLLQEIRYSSPNAELLLTAFLRGLLEPSDGTKAPAHTGKTQRAVFAVKHLIDLHYRRPLTYEDFCRHVDLSPSYLCQAFAQLIGMSPTEYLLQIRVEHAKRLLREPNRQVAEVGRAVGVNNPNYFARLFRRKTGQSPSEYLKATGG